MGRGTDQGCHVGDTGSVSIADMDRDGFNDLITGPQQFGDVEIYFGQ